MIVPPTPKVLATNTDGSLLVRFTRSYMNEDSFGSTINFSGKVWNIKHVDWEERTGILYPLYVGGADKYYDR